MQVERLAIPDVLLLRPRVFTDERGHFFESWSREQYREVGILEEFVQDNVSVSQKGVLRGLHAQRSPDAQGKLVTVLKGRVFDVAVDARRDSETYGRWVAVELSGEEANQLYVPPGFLHGFLTLQDDTIFTYKCTNRYNPETEITVRWNDPAIGIRWPVDQVLISSKDSTGKLLADI